MCKQLLGAFRFQGAISVEGFEIVAGVEFSELRSLARLGSQKSGTSFG